MRKQVHKSYLLTLLLFMWAVSVHAQNPHVVLDWAKLTGGTGIEFGFGTATDAMGNVYTSGSFSNTVDMDPGPGVTNITGNYVDVFISKFDAAGNFKWVKYFGNSREDKPFGIKTDKWGNVYVTGQVADSVDFNPGGPGGKIKGSGFADAFVVKYNTNGDFKWVARSRRIELGSSGDNIGYNLCVDDTANVYVIGAYSDTSDFDPGPGTFALINSGTYSTDVFIWKLDSAGNFKWAKSMGSPGFGNEQGFDIAFDKGGNLISTGIFQGVADFDPGPGVQNITATGSYDIFLSKLDANGDYVWAKRFGNSSMSMGIGVAIDPSDNILITGTYEGSVDFDPNMGTTMLNAVGGTDIYIVKINSGGNLVWAKSIGGFDYDSGEDIAVDARGNVYTTGFYPGTAYTIDLDPGPGIASFASNGDNDMFTMKLDFNGNYKWGKVMGGLGMDVSKGVSVDRHGSVYTAGYTQQTVDFDPNTGVYNQTSNGDWDFFVHKMICTDTNSSVVAVDVCDDTYTFGTETYIVSGSYQQKMPNIEGCDSTIFLILDLKGKVIKPLININGFDLGTTMAYAAYQWFKNGVAVTGGTGAIYSVTENADYRVVVFNARGCSDTSDVLTVTNVGIGDLSFVKNDIKIYPNPASDVINITSPIAVNVTLNTLDGRMVKQVANAKQVSVNGLAEGMYLLHITDENGNMLKVEKIIKQGR